MYLVWIILLSNIYLYTYMYTHQTLYEATVERLHVSNSIFFFNRVAIPPRTSSIKTFFENSTKVQENFSLKRYERKLRVSIINF